MSGVNFHASPIISHLAWGEMAIEDCGTGKDFKLWPGGGRHWDWSETGTEHIPGILPGDIYELIEHGSEIIILSQGMLKRLKTSPDTIGILQARGIEIKTAPTQEAAEIYNELAREHKAVGGLFHSTC